MEKELDEIIETALCGDISESTKKDLIETLVAYIEKKIEDGIEDNGWATMDRR